MTPEQQALATVADLMALAARTAPKGKGADTLEIRVLNKAACRRLAKHLENMGNERGIGFFIRDARNIADADTCVLIGSRADTVAGINCGGCGHASCTAFEKAIKNKKAGTSPYSGPNCAIRVTDLGVAIGSAAKTAQIHNADNRILYSGGVAALDMGLLAESTVAYAIPLSGTGKNIFFDRPSSR